MSETDFGEADRIYNIYTKDFGKISVLAKGIRLEKSKLRTHLTPRSLIRLSFVEGKEFMRLIDAEEIYNLPVNEEIFASFTRAAAFFARMIKGQEKDEAVWELMRGILSDIECLTVEWFEPLFEARLLHRLGYVSLPDKNLGKIISENNWFQPALPKEEISALKNISYKAAMASQL